MHLKNHKRKNKFLKNTKVMVMCQSILITTKRSEKMSLSRKQSTKKMLNYLLVPD